MPRLARYVLPGQPQHVIQRGNNRSPLFNVDADYVCFRQYLQDACRRHGCHVHAYVLMTNHVHLLMTPETKEGISKVMQSVGRRYVQYFNKRYRRTGTLWEGRYKATIIDSESYLLTCCRYIELNPVRAHLVGHPAEYRWSSYRTNALGKQDDLVRCHDLYRALGVNEAGRRAAYRGLFESHLDDKAIEEIRQATQKGWALGKEAFKDKMERQVRRRSRPLARGGDHRSAAFRQSRIDRSRTGFNRV